LINEIFKGEVQCRFSIMISAQRRMTQCCSGSIGKVEIKRGRDNEGRRKNKNSKDLRMTMQGTMNERERRGKEERNKEE
jgi:hypothetical protein